MKTSEQIDKIAPAFIKAQAEFGKATKDSTNPFFKKIHQRLKKSRVKNGEDWDR